MWRRDPFQFQNWAVEYVSGFCTNKKTRDGGVDGRLYFKERGRRGQSNLKGMIISVKGGKLNLSDVRDLMGVVTSDPQGVFGGIISFDEPTKAMRDFQAEQGLYQGNKQYPVLQFLSVKEMLENKRLFNIPNTVNRKDTNKNRQQEIYF
ncbi:MAG: hypothetical protein OXH57_08450 [Ekhidna sp.]|nr:hypothetical protein [Ekhidna sp.]